MVGTNFALRFPMMMSSFDGSSTRYRLRLLVGVAQLVRRLTQLHGLDLRRSNRRRTSAGMDEVEHATVGINVLSIRHTTDSSSLPIKVRTLYGNFLIPLIPVMSKPWFSLKMRDELSHYEKNYPHNSRSLQQPYQVSAQSAYR
jgi:hypothetical protein